MDKNKKNIIKYRRKQDPSMKINLLVFLLIAGYLLYTIISYITDSPVSTYEVQQGSIVSNEVYKGLILRDETIVYSSHAGYINYYIKSGSKAAVTDPVYSIDTDGNISELISTAAQNGTSLDTGSRTSLLNSISSFESSYNSEDFENVYSFKQDFASELNQDFSLTALNNLDSSLLDQASNSTFFLSYPQVPGIIAYYVDGYEDMTVASYSVSDMVSTGYKKETLDDRTKINKSDPVYKLIASEEWNVIINITAEKAEKLKNHTSTKVRFCKDGFTTRASYTLERDGNNYYLNLKLTTGMIRYLSDRFTEIELVSDQNEGLKIPSSAITQREFYRIPAVCFTESEVETTSEGNSSHSVTTIGTGKQHLLIKGSDGDPVSREIIVYYAEDNYGYVSENDIDAGTVLQYPNSQKTYTVGCDIYPANIRISNTDSTEAADGEEDNTTAANTESANSETESSQTQNRVSGTEMLNGVYNVNKGYAVFRLVQEYESDSENNSDYVIVAPDTYYGISLYDHIALDASGLYDGKVTTR